MTDFGWDYPPGVSDRDFTDGPPHDSECDCPACEEARLPKCRKCGASLHNAVHEDGLCADCLKKAQQAWGFHTMESLAIMAWRYGIDARICDVMKAERERGITARDCDRERFRLGLPPVPDQSLDDMDKTCDSCPALAGCPNWGHGKDCDCRVCREAGIS